VLAWKSQAAAEVAARRSEPEVEAAEAAAVEEVAVTAVAWSSAAADPGWAPSSSR
jgi:hypothetical protein